MPGCLPAGSPEQIGRSQKRTSMKNPRACAILRLFCYCACKRQQTAAGWTGKTRDLLRGIPYLLGMALACTVGFLCVTAVIGEPPRGPMVNLVIDWSGATAFSNHAKSPPLGPAPVRQAALPAAPRSILPAPQVQHPEPLAHSLTRLVAFKTAPFPYDGVIPRSNQPFLNHSEDGRAGRKTGSGRIYWADETYNDSRVLLHIPKGFDPSRPSVMVVFFHGHGATLQRDVAARQQVPAQIDRSAMNAVLVAPQFAVDARDSSAGKLWREGGMKRFLDEVAAKLAAAYGDPSAREHFAKMPVVIVGYSGGYLPTAATIAHGGIGDRLKGVVLLDGLYGNVETFADWVTGNDGGFFVSAYTSSTRRGNGALKSLLSERDIAVTDEMPRRLKSGSVAIISANEEHRDYVTRAWTDYPITDMLARIEGVAPREPMAVSASLAPAFTN